MRGLLAALALACAGLASAAEPVAFLHVNVLTMDGLPTLRRPLGVMAGGQRCDAAALPALRNDVARRYEQAR